MATALGRVAIVLDMEGDAERGIQRVAARLEGLESVGEKTAKNLMNSFGRMNSALMGGSEGRKKQQEELNGIGDLYDRMGRDIHSGMRSMGVLAIGEILSMIDSAGQALQNFGARILGTLAGISAEIIQTAITFETLEAAFARLYGDRAEAAMARMDEVAELTTFSTEQVGNLATMMMTSGIDALFTDAATSTGQMVNSLEILSDLASTKGAAGMNHLMLALQNFIGSGDLKSMQMRMDIPVATIDQIKEKVKEAGGEAATAQERFAAFIEVIGAQYGGIGRSMENTTGFILNRFEDVKQLLFRDIGRASLEVIRPLLSDIVDFFGELRSNEDRIAALRELFQSLVRPAVAVARALWNVIRAVIDFGTRHPMMTRVFVTLLATLGVVSVLAGAAISFLATLVLVTAAFVALGSAIVLFVLPFLAPLVPIFVALGAAFTVMYAVWARNTLGIRTFTERLVTGLRALYEIFTTLEGNQGRLSRSTYTELTRLGISDFVLNLASNLRRFLSFVEGFWAGLKVAFQAGWEVIGPIFNQFMEALTGSKTSASSEMGVPTFMDWINSMSPEDWEVLGKNAGLFMLNVVDGLRTLVEFGTQVASIFSMVSETIKSVANAIASVLPYILMAMGPIGSIVRTIAGSPLAETFNRVMDSIVPTRAGVVQPVHEPRASTGPSVQPAPAQMDPHEFHVRNKASLAQEGRAKHERIVLQVDGRVLAEVTSEHSQRQTQRLGVGG